MELFLASDQPINPSHGWKGERYLTVGDIDETEQRVRAHFTLPHVRFLGAHTGCSCGFEYGVKELTTEEERAEDEAGRLSVAALHDFLETQLRQGRAVQLLSCWQGEESRTPREVLEVSPDYFGGKSFDLPRSAFLKIRGAVEQRDAADEAREG